MVQLFVVTCVYSLSSINYTIIFTNRMSSKIFHLTSQNSDMVINIFPPIQISPNAVMGLTHFQAYNSIPNVTSLNNQFSYKDSNDNWCEENIPEGSYELSDIEQYLQDRIGGENVKIQANINTLKCNFWCKYDVDFTKSNSIGQLIGIPQQIYKSNSDVTSVDIIQISKVNSIQVHVNITSGSFINGVASDCLYKCFITTPPGYRIIEIPINVVYLPVTTTEIDTIHIRVTDQNNSLINFRNEEIAIELHLKE